jgi:hypothetical protein
MRQAENAISRSLLLVLALLLGLSPLDNVKPALADPGILAWTVVDTPAPSPDTNIIVSPSEINALAIGYDDKTFYAVDIPGDPVYPNGKIYKSTDGGITWTDVLSRSIDAVANLPAWNIAVAPDDVNFVVVVTDGDGTPNGPQAVFVSTDGGANWENTNFPPLVGEYISCVDISMEHGSIRDIAVGTRTGVGTGRVFVLKGPGLAGWADQGFTGDVVALKISPSYLTDLSVVVISSSAAATFLNLGDRDIDDNKTNWNTSASYPVLILDGSYAGNSPNATQIITADLELPSDFSGSAPGDFRRYYVSTDAVAGVQTGVYRIDNTEVHLIRPPMALPTDRISSIAYLGAYDGGELLAGEVTAVSGRGMVNVWRTYDPISNTPQWLKSDALKSPTGGGIPVPLPPPPPQSPYYANAQLAWSPNVARAYCGTSSADFVNGGTSMVLGSQCWPEALLNPVQWDESAFSVSPYTPAYEQLLEFTGKPKDTDIGNIWNQLSLIDTEISFLSDVAILEVPAATDQGEPPKDYSVLYLASINTAGVPSSFDSIWRSTSSPLGRTWERILCTATTNDDIILRINPRITEEGDRSQVIVFADRTIPPAPADVGYSSNEGQSWQALTPGANVSVTDLTLTSDEVMYILNNALVRKGSKGSPGWRWQSDVDTYLTSGHTIATPLKNPEKESDEGNEDWVIVGEAGPPLGQGRVAYADFSEVTPKFEPPVSIRIQVPAPGNIHVIADGKFEQNKTIYAASDSPNGKIYRWVIDKSTAWEELEPPNNSFFGLVQRNDVLYGVWDVPAPPNTTQGVDRTLYSRDVVPPALEWDDLTAELPATVHFTLEPSSLKISSNDYNNLWAIDNSPPYNWATQVGCLWGYTDTIARVGPWTLSPASGDLIPVDPVSGRAQEVNFKWRQLSYASVYELQIAKDSEFNILVLLSDNITPTDQLAPACYFPSGGLVPAPASAIASWGNLECGHTYYWRVRARGSITGDIVRSPWSATMHFTVETGLPARTKQLGPALLKPVDCARGVSPSSAFSWSPIPGTTKYEFILARDAALTQVVVKAKVSTTAYEYDDKLDWNTAYFWQVQAIEPMASEPSSTATFTVIAKEVPLETNATQSAATTLWVWVGIAIYVALVAAVIVLIRRKHVYDDTEAAESRLIFTISRTREALSDIKDSVIARIRGNGY